MKKIFLLIVVIALIVIGMSAVNVTAYASHGTIETDPTYLAVGTSDRSLGIVSKGPETVLAEFTFRASGADVGVSLFEIGTTNLGTSLGKIKIQVADKIFVTSFLHQDEYTLLGQGGPFPLFIVPKDGGVTMTLTADTTQVPDGSIFTFTILDVRYQPQGQFNPEISKSVWGRPTSNPISILGGPDIVSPQIEIRKLKAQRDRLISELISNLVARIAELRAQLDLVK